MANVKFYVQGDNSSAMRALSQVNARVQGLSNSLNSGLKGAIAGAFSVYAIGAAVRSTVEFADNIDKTAQRLGVTTEYVQVLKRIARDTGKEFGVLEKALINVNDAAQDAFSGNKTKKNAFAMLGISEEDLGRLNPKDLLTKTAKGAQGLPREQALAAYTDIFGKKEAGTLLGASGQLANPTAVMEEMKKLGQLASDSDIDRIAQLQDAFEDLADTVRVALIPALTGLIEWATNLVSGYKDATTTYTDKDKQAEAIYMKKYGKAPSQVGSFMDSMHYQTGALFASLNPFTNKDEKQKRYKELQDQHLKWSYGQDVVDEMNKTYKPESVSLMDQLQAQKDKRKAEREQRRKEVEGDIKRTVTGTPEKDVKYSPTELKSSPSPYVSIGGIAGVNAQYRIERINKDMLEQLKKLVQLVEQQTTQQPESGFK